IAVFNRVINSKGSLSSPGKFAFFNRARTYESPAATGTPVLEPALKAPPGGLIIRLDRAHLTAPVNLPETDIWESEKATDDMLSLLQVTCFETGAGGVVPYEQGQITSLHAESAGRSGSQERNRGPRIDEQG